MGFVGLQFDVATAGLDLTSLSTSGLREFRHMLGSHDQPLVSLSLDLGAKGVGPGADVDLQLTRLDQAMQTAKALGAGALCVEIGPLPPPPTAAKPKPRINPDMTGAILLPTFSAAPAPETTNLAEIPPVVDPNFFAQVDAALADLGQRADRYSVVLALRSELASFAALERALRQANCPWFGVDLDPPGLLVDAWEMDELFSRLGPLVRHVRARDAVRGADRRTKPAIIGRGSVDWPALLAGLDATGYNGWITLDPTDLPDRPAAATAGRETLLAIQME
jgi:sugar phosphate isomerase/epimerase